MFRFHFHVIQTFANFCYDFVFDPWDVQNCAIQFPMIWGFPQCACGFSLKCIMVREHKHVIVAFETYSVAQAQSVLLISFFKKYLFIWLR